jgi:cell division protease FtsH
MKKAFNLIRRFWREIFRRRMPKTVALLVYFAMGIIFISAAMQFTVGYVVIKKLDQPPPYPQTSYSDFVRKAIDQEFKSDLVFRKLYLQVHERGVVVFETKDGKLGWAYLTVAPTPLIGSPQEWLRQLRYNVHEEFVFPWGWLVTQLGQSTQMSITSILGILMFAWFVVGGGMKSMTEEFTAISLSKKLAGQKVAFKDVAGLDSAIEGLKEEVIPFLKKADKFQKLKARMPKGGILYGPPGTGKTLLARALATEAGVPFFAISGSDFHKMYVGVGGERADALFNQAIRAAPSIVFIDELDSAAPRRDMLSPHDAGGERRSLVNKLLSLMDRIEKEDIPVFVLGSTNMLEAIDKALLREGRMDIKIEVPLPMEIEARESIFRVHTSRPKPKPLAEDVSLRALAEMTLGFSGAQIAAMVNLAAIQAGRKDRDTITQQDFLDSFERAILGPEQHKELTKHDLEVISSHEAGHAWTANKYMPEDPVQVISISPRAHALGWMHNPASRPYYLETKRRLSARIKTYMAGRAAERVLYGEDGITNGAKNDIKMANFIAYDMVVEYGMSPLGHISLEKPMAGIYDAGGWAQKLYDGAFDEIQKIIDDNYQEVCRELGEEENKAKLIELRDELMKKKRLVRKEFEDIINKKQPD